MKNTIIFLLTTNIKITQKIFYFFALALNLLKGFFERALIFLPQFSLRFNLGIPSKESEDGGYAIERDKDNFSRAAIVTYAIFTTFVSSTLCMNEQPQPRQQTSSYANAEFILSSVEGEDRQQKPLLFAPYSTTEIPIPVYITANEPGWEKYNQIMNVPYKNNTPINQKPTDLTPIYLPTMPDTTANKNYIIMPTTRNKSQEKKPSLRTLTPSQPDQYLMQQLHDCASELIWGRRSNKTPIFLIKQMNYAKQQGITEDMMGSFSYNNPGWFDDTTTSDRRVLLWHCLKVYAINRQQTQEAVPHGELANRLGLNNNYSREHYPAYTLLEKNIKALFTKVNFDTMHRLVWCLYKDPKIIDVSSVDGSYSNLNDEFYTQGEAVLIYNLKLNYILAMIDKAKEAQDITSEQDLGYHMLTYETPLFNDVVNTLMPHTPMPDIQKRISLLCLFITKYNQTRGTKITPTSDQHYCYQLIHKLNLALPNSFNSTIFDDNHYAFIELEELINDITILRTTENNEVLQSINTLYPTKK